MTHEQEILALADKIGAWTPSSGMLVLIARERRMIEDALRAAIQPQQMRDALVSYRFAQKWATGTEEHRLAIQVADAINPLPPWYEIETPSHTRPECGESK